MKGSIRLCKVFGISINIHFTFLLLLALFLSIGAKWLFLVAGIFFFVTLHELAHSLVAVSFGIKVKEITLLPIGGISSMSKMPEKPSQELLISLAGPLLNMVVVAIFFFPLSSILGRDTLFHPLSVATWPLAVAYIYWINLLLAGFNLIPAFPMDGGRILRSILAQRISYQKATRIAVAFGHIFALAFAYFGIMRFNIVLIAISVFIFMSASSEESQVDVNETLKKIKVKDILSGDFLTVNINAVLAKVLELMMHHRQEDFPVVEDQTLVGFITRKDIIMNVHNFGVDRLVRDCMRTHFTKARDTDSLLKVHNMMQVNDIKAMPVVKDDAVIGVVSLEDVARVYSLTSQKAYGERS